jgi:hypothetical protein
MKYLIQLKTLGSAVVEQVNWKLKATGARATAAPQLLAYGLASRQLAVSPTSFLLSVYAGR